MPDDPTLTRRGFLTGLVAAVFAAAHGVEAASCPPTEDNPQGPFYVSGAPFRVGIAPDDEPGERLVVTGRVLSATDCRPLPGAVVDVWHASDAGAYYGMEGAGGDDAWRLRGRASTGPTGAYRFETILPGRYPLGPRRLRPRHIHYLVTHPAHRPLVTQLYFAGDPFLEGDGLVRRSLIVPLASPPAAGGAPKRLAATFDVVLSPLKQ